MVREDSHASAWNTSLGSDRGACYSSSVEHLRSGFYSIASQPCDAAWVVSRSAYGALLRA